MWEILYTSLDLKGTGTGEAPCRALYPPLKIQICIGFSICTFRESARSPSSGQKKVIRAME